MYLTCVCEHERVDVPIDFCYFFMQKLLYYSLYIRIINKIVWIDQNITRISVK